MSNATLVESDPKQDECPSEEGIYTKTIPSGSSISGSFYLGGSGIVSIGCGGGGGGGSCQYCGHLYEPGITIPAPTLRRDIATLDARLASIESKLDKFLNRENKD
jgi:hypothetical protein